VHAPTARLAWPLASVVAVAPPGKVGPAPLPDPANVTVTPEMGLPKPSVTFTTSGLMNAVPMVADCPPPETTAMVPGPVVLVSPNDALPATPAVVAVTVYPPATVLAVTETPAWPSGSVVAVGSPGNVTPAPVGGPANVTVAPAIGFA
jgi:hypothetical protein